MIFWPRMAFIFCKEVIIIRKATFMDSDARGGQRKRRLPCYSHTTIWGIGKLCFASSITEPAILSLRFSRWGSRYLTLGNGKQQVIGGNKFECDCPKNSREVWEL